MGTLEQVKQASLRELAGLSGPCITIVLAGDEKGDTRVELKEALHTVRRELTGMVSDADALLKPVMDASTELHSNTKARGPIVILRSPEVFVMERDASPPEKHLKSLVKVGDHFDVRTLVTLLSQVSRFYILAFSQNHTRILECSKSAPRELPFPPGFPSSLDESMQTRQPDHVLDSRSAAGPSIGSMKGVMFGTSTDRDDKYEYLHNFAREIDRAVNAVLRGHEEPLVIVGVEHEIALYRRVNTYPHLAEPGIHGSPDSMDVVEMHRRALELLNSSPDEAARRALADFDKKVGTGHASMHIQEILTAAWEGRNAWMFLQDTAHYPGTFDPVRTQVNHTVDPVECPVDLIEDAALQTLSHGGDVRVMPAAAMPNGVPVCAIFRYAAVKATNVSGD